MFGFPHNTLNNIQKVTFIREDESFPSGENEKTGDTCLLITGKIYIYNGAS
jgi:hypothetical protein